ncbi:GlxA family transcriptional regulator [Labrys sp. KNU-23]|uniref:GlxA family transcriptional regulator n=1 Tax=Labrys sp. KNU-23 TaxID=2789216 RepID=UPI001AEEF508|nr:GlxA family transcriptional regulator [Labrys sp. KNU-23]
MSGNETRTIAILALQGVQLLDVSGPMDVFAEANTQAGREAYRLRIVAQGAEAIRSSSGARLLADIVIGTDDGGPVDTLLVAGSPNAAVTAPDEAVVAWLKRVAATTRRYGSVCAGAFVLAAAGLLAGRQVATHWAVADRLARAYPDIAVDPDAIHIRDGRLRTAAGVTAGLDLALALVEEDLGREIAMRVAAQLVMFFKRPGGQMQFSRREEAVPAGRSALQELQRWVVANPAERHSVASMAGRLGLSPRHFARLFVTEVGVTPAGWVEATRISVARRWLETSGSPPKQVAAACGFANADMLRRAFMRHVGVTPADYRKRFTAKD